MITVESTSKQTASALRSACLACSTRVPIVEAAAYMRPSAGTERSAATGRKSIVGDVQVEKKWLPIGTMGGNERDSRKRGLERNASAAAHLGELACVPKRSLIEQV